MKVAFEMSYSSTLIEPLNRPMYKHPDDKYAPEERVKVKFKRNIQRSEEKKRDRGEVKIF